MIARDQGCSFPGCTAPPLWTEAHHITDYALGGKTSVDNGTLLCRFDHDNHVKNGWTCRMINGTPHWVPPNAVQLCGEIEHSDLGWSVVVDDPVVGLTGPVCP